MPESIVAVSTGNIVLYLITLVNRYFHYIYIIDPASCQLPNLKVSNSNFEFCCDMLRRRDEAQKLLKEAIQILDGQ